MEGKDHQIQQTDHQVYFAGEHPHNIDGTPLNGLGGGKYEIILSEHCRDVNVQRSFSTKPKSGHYDDFFHKVDHYVTLISGPATYLHGADPYTFRTMESILSDPIFKYQDTLTSRAETADLAKTFHEDVVALIGLGGTGAYLLDFLVKTPVKEIRGFDSDTYYIHNAFRSPGRLDDEDLSKSKAKVYAGRYENFRHGLSFHNCHIDNNSKALLDGVTFAFVCVDNGSSRKEIFDLLISMGIPFINVGMGLNRNLGNIKGMIRSSYYAEDKFQETVDKGLATLEDNPDDEYKTNIQISELNAINACFAMIMFKQLRGFYFAENSFYDLLFEFSDLSISGMSFGEDEN